MLGIFRFQIGRIWKELCLNLNLKKQTAKGLTFEFLSHKILENFKRNEFRISQNKYLMFREMLCYAKLAVRMPVLYFSKQNI